MKKITLLLLILPFIALAQLNPILGIKYTGGLSYDMEHEYPSAQIGIQYNFQESNFTDVSASFEYIYDYTQQFNGKHNFYVVKGQSSNKFSEFISVTYFGGYLGGIDNTKKQFKGYLKTNLVWGGGIRYTGDNSYVELMYENLAGYPHISIGLHFKLWKLTN